MVNVVAHTVVKGFNVDETVGDVVKLLVEVLINFVEPLAKLVVVV